MKYPAAYLAGLIVLTSATGYSTILFQDSADLANFTTANTNATTARVLVVDGSTTPVSTLDGDALRFSDTATGLLPALRHQTSVELADALKVSFDVKIASVSSNVVFRVGPDASLLGAASSSSFGVQLTNSGTVATEQSPSNVNYTSSFSTTNRFNLTMFYNASDAAIDLTAYNGPASLGSHKWALYVDGTLKSSALAEKSSQIYGSSFGFAWLSGTGANTPSMDFQLDNIQYTNISAIPEPSSAAALIGFGVLGFVASGRRRRALTS